jgi:hypothetical protein
MGALADLIAPFVDSVASRRTELHNEFSLQHELGISLRGKLPARKVQFERNVFFFFPSKASFTKREIDISVFSPGTKELAYAIELKYPRNGQYTEQMFSFCEDVAFALVRGSYVVRWKPVVDSLKYAVIEVKRGD